MSRAGTETVDERVLALRNLSPSVSEDLEKFLENSQDLLRSEFLENLEVCVNKFLTRDDVSESDKDILRNFLEYSIRTPKGWTIILKIIIKIIKK